jgi:hypothetical protein
VLPPARQMSYHKWPIPMTKSTIVGGCRLFSIIIPSFLHTFSTINGYNALNRREGRGIRVLVVRKVPPSCRAMSGPPPSASKEWIAGDPLLRGRKRDNEISNGIVR